MISNDLVFDDNNALRIENGDLVIGQSDDENLEAIMLANKGQFVQNPLLGYGIGNKKFGNFVTLTERRLIRREITKDNYKITRLNISSDFQIDLEAEKIK
jgi:hypothetical protein